MDLMIKNGFLICEEQVPLKGKKPLMVNISHVKTIRPYGSPETQEWTIVDLIDESHYVIVGSFEAVRTLIICRGRL